MAALHRRYATGAALYGIETRRGTTGGDRATSRVEITRRDTDIGLFDSLDDLDFLLSPHG